MAGTLSRRALCLLDTLSLASKRGPLTAVHILGHREEDAAPLPAVLQDQTSKSTPSQILGQCKPAYVNPIFPLSINSFHSSIACHETAIDKVEAQGLDEKLKEELKEDVARVAPKTDAVTDTKALVRSSMLTMLRERLKDHERAWVSLPELYAMCKETGSADNDEEAAQVVADLDKAGVLLQLKDKAFLRPEEIAHQVLQALPAPLVDENDSRIKEFEQMQLEKKAIDIAARRYARRYLWIGWGALSLQTAFFFRLTFWELSWDVMEPITYFAAMTTGILGYAWFLVTRTEPNYSDAFSKFYHTKQEKVAAERHFDMDRYYRLHRQVLSFRKRQARMRAAIEDDDD